MGILARMSFAKMAMWTLAIMLAVGMLVLPQSAQAQAPVCTPTPGTLVGNATTLASNEIQLTPNAAQQRGAFWATQPIDLTQPFDITSQVYLGATDGADGLAFVLRPSTAANLGEPGLGIGAGDGNSVPGITPSLIVEIDTFQNSVLNYDFGWNDPASDHIAVYLNGNGRHDAAATSLTGAIAIPNIEDNADHAFRTQWNPTTQALTVSLDGVTRATVTVDIATALGTTTPLWGYTASTGAVTNRHAICNQMPSLQLSKTTVGGTGAFSFNATNGFGTQTLTTATAGTPVSGAAKLIQMASTAGTITETMPPGWTMTAASCTDLGSGTATPDLAAGTITFDALALAAGNRMVCSVTNTRATSITLSKTSVGGTGSFTFTGNNGWTSQNISTVTAGTPVSGTTQTLTAGVATTITETIPSGWAMTGASCTGIGSGTATVDLVAGTISLNAAAMAAGNNVSCSVTNTLMAPRIRLLKAIGGERLSQSDHFTLNLTNTATSAVTSGTTTFTGWTPAPQQVVDVLAEAGAAYAITEDMAPGSPTPRDTYEASISCTNANATSTTVLPSGIGTRFPLTPAVGDDITCTVTNNILPYISLSKRVVNDAGGTAVAADWTLTATQTLDGAGNPPVTPFVISGVTDDPAIYNVRVPTGTYVLSESGSPANYAAGEWFCEVNSGFQSGATFTVSYGTSAICEITNTFMSADLVVTKSNGVSSVTAGGTTTYTVRVSNSGLSAVTGGTFSDPPATGLTKTGVICSAAASNLCTTAPDLASLEAGTLVLPTLAVNEFYEVEIAATVDATSGSVTNRASATVPAGTLDPDTGNNTDISDTDTVNPMADLVVVKANGGTSVISGATTTYTLTVTNNGPSTATGAVVTDTVGSNLDCPATNPVSFTGDGVPAGSFNLGDLTGTGITLGTLAPGQTTTLSFVCNIP